MKNLMLFLLLLITPLYASQVNSGGGGSPEGTVVKSTGEGSGLVLTSNGSDGASWTSVAGTGDVVGPAASVDSEIALYSSTSGKLLKRASGTGLCKATSGVASFATLVDADVSASAGLTRSKFASGTAFRVVTNDTSGVMTDAAAITAARVLISDANGIPTHSSVTSTTLAFLDASSSVQTQINTKAPSASPTFTGTVTTPVTASRVVVTGASSELAASSVTSATLALLAPSEFDAGNSSTADTIDWSQGTAQKSTLTGNVTYTLSNPVTGTSYVLRIATGAGGFSATWPGTVKWSGGTAPTITATASKVDLINLYWDGTSYYGSFTQNY